MNWGSEFETGLTMGLFVALVYMVGFDFMWARRYNVLLKKYYELRDRQP
jgi:hypothetical protein